MPELSMEERAVAAGWVPKEQFRGNPDNHLSAEEFMKVAEEKMPQMKGTLTKLEQTIAEQNETMRLQNETIESIKKDFTEFVEFSRSTEQRAYERALGDLRKEQQAARASGDLEKFAEVTDAIDEKIKEGQALTGKGEVGPKSPDDEYRQWLASEPNAFENWKSEQKWYVEEPEMFQYAEAMDRFVFNQHGLKLSPSKRLAKVTELVKKKFPDYFGNPAAKTGSPVEGDSGGRASSGGGKTYADLPPDVKTQCDKFTGKDGKGTSGSAPGLTREQFCEQYFGKERSHG